MMKRFWQHTYSFFVIPILWLVLRMLGAFTKKIRKGIRGRHAVFEVLKDQVAQLGPGKRVWFHSSSMGEFEQAKPIIERLRKKNGSVKIIATFFSPSGYEHSKKYHVADVISYLPFDTRNGAKRFLDLVRPDAAVMVRYDVWPNHIWELNRRGVPILIANATMSRRTARRIPLVRSFHHYVYNAIDNIMTVSDSDVEAFGFFTLDHPKVQVIGDTRYDQVASRSVEAKKRHIIPPGITDGKKVIVIGSSWPEDEDVVLPAFLKLQETIPDLLLVLVPHEPTIEYIEELENRLTQKTSFIRFSALNEYARERVIIVDSIGILFILYAYAHIAYIGGSFRQGVHNVLEAAVFGVPVIFGPRHRNSQEPLMLVERGGGFVVNDSGELYRTFRNLLEDESARASAGERAALFVHANVGATERFIEHLEPYLHDRRTHPPTA
jgi:3-deoxy-D-manno-octulosonic-acid transferase